MDTSVSDKPADIDSDSEMETSANVDNNAVSEEITLAIHDLSNTGETESICNLENATTNSVTNLFESTLHTDNSSCIEEPSNAAISPEMSEKTSNYESEGNKNSGAINEGYDLVKEDIIFDIPGLSSECINNSESESKTISEKVSTDSFNGTGQLDDSDGMRDATMESSEPTSSTLSSEFLEDNTSKFQELESTISHILSNICDDQQNDEKDDSITTKSSFKENTKHVEDADESSLDNDGDALGLLAEAEGRERHSSENEEEEDEEGEDEEGDDEEGEDDEGEGESDIESSVNNDEQESDDYDEDRDVDDDDYQPKSDEEEDDFDDEDVDDPELGTYIKRKRLLKNLGASTDELNDESTTDFETSLQSNADACAGDSTINDTGLSIFNITSLAPPEPDNEDTAQSESGTQKDDQMDVDNSFVRIESTTSLSTNEGVKSTENTTANHLQHNELWAQKPVEDKATEDSNDVEMEDKATVDSNDVEMKGSEPTSKQVPQELASMSEDSVADKCDASPVNENISEVEHTSIESEEKPKEPEDVSSEKKNDEDVPMEECVDTSNKDDSLIEKTCDIPVVKDINDSVTSHKEAVVSNETISEKENTLSTKELDNKKVKPDVTLVDTKTISNDTKSTRANFKKSTVTEKVPAQVYTLDSDDEDEPLSKIGQKRPAQRGKKSLEKCINPTCLVSQKLVPCPQFIPSIFRAKDVPPIPKACRVCLDSGTAIMENLTSRLKTGFTLMDVEMPNNQDLVEISDSDSDSDAEGNSDKLYKGGWRIKSAKATDTFDEEDLKVCEELPDFIEEVWEKLDVERHLKLCEKKLSEKIDALDVESFNIEAMISREQKLLDNIRKKLYETFKPPTECKTELIITDSGSRFTTQSSAFPERRSTRIRKQIINTYDMDNEEVTYTADSVSVSDLDVHVSELEKHPPVGRLPDYALNVGDVVYAVRQSIFGAWCLARIVRVMPRGTKLANGTLSQFSLVSVHFLQGNEGDQITKQVTGRQVAYASPSPVLYPVGTRVIALFQNKQQLKEAYYSGIIAEYPVKQNRYRYLVFFDDGYARYVYHKYILLVSQRSTHAWEDVHPDSRDFIRKYLQGFSNHPMVRVEPGHLIKVEYKGKFVSSRVVCVDTSLALIRFSVSVGVPPNHEEWIYRGSTRLEPLFLELQTADRKAHGRSRASYATTNLNKSQHFPYVEYSRHDQPDADKTATEAKNDSLPPPTATKNDMREQNASNRSVAKKSTVGYKDNLIKNKEPVNKEQPVQQMHADQVKSKVVYYSPKVTIKPKKLKPHQCNPECLNKDAIALRELRTYNPLARPLLSGWQRLITKFRGKRTIMYLTPCGRRLRNPRELHLYLRLTRCQMSVDLFDFDHWVHCLAEFMPTKCFVSKKDLSHGVEAVPVPCVNYYDHTLPEFSAYSTRRIPTRGVNLNLDEDFLCGCDCTDDCQDRNKCQCWQLTLEGASIIGSQAHRVGYQYKRLLEPVPTGIYECNSRCKCAATCLNRVVQHPLQLKLQVFKTFNRGWGIRALNDVSKGTFICIYAGNLLTDAVANVDGVTEGDEYLAELDYIEVVERLKENYESDVPEEDKITEESEDLSDNEGSQKEDGNKKPHGESDDEFKPHFKLDPVDGNAQRQLRKKRSEKKKEDKAVEKESIKDQNVTEKETVSASREERSVSLDDDSVIPVVDEFITISDDEEKREPSRFAAPDNLNDDDYVPKRRSVRSFFGKDEACYIMDAKVQGNLGRYLNHSCAPNVFVQNVFVDTHDPRFPWVAFFTLNHVRAGTELTWNYNYDIGSVPDKVIFCKCGATNCRGRLL